MPYCRERGGAPSPLFLPFGAKIIEARLNFIAPRFNAVLQGKGGSPLPYFLPFGAQIVEARLNFIAPRFNAVLQKKGVEGD